MIFGEAMGSNLFEEFVDTKGAADSGSDLSAPYASAVDMAGNTNRTKEGSRR